MTFEVELRERLQREAASVPLPGRDPRIAASRARTIRHRRQMTAAGMVVLSAAVILGAPLLLADQAGDKDEPGVLTGPGYGLPETGPIELDWQTAPDGLLFPTMSFQDAEGVVYAISTAPGRTPPGRDTLPRALYRLGEGGTWEPVLVDEEHNQLADLVAGEDGLLYAIGTAPAEDGDGTLANLTTSGDGGETWTTNLQVQPTSPPSAEVEWDTYTDVAIETNGSTMLASVTTSFFPKYEQFFPELEGQGSESLSVELRAEGLVLIQYDLSDEESVVRSGAGEDPIVMTMPEGTPVKTVSWAELGVDGQQALSTTQMFVRAGDGWQDVSAPEVRGVGTTGLTVAAGRFVATGYDPADPDATRALVLTSEDGLTWTPIETPVDGEVVGLGDALVNLGWVDGPDRDQVSVSTDAGATWTDINLDEIGIPPGSAVYAGAAGPLGLALLVGPADLVTGPEQLLFTGDLIDWTVTDVAEITGLGSDATFDVFVGENQVVLTAATMTLPAQSATAVGTPVR